MLTLDQLLSRVVERRGFAVQGTDAEALFAKKGDELLLTAWKTDAPVTAPEAGMFLAALEQVHATSGILVATQGVDAAAVTLAPFLGVVMISYASESAFWIGVAGAPRAWDGIMAGPAAPAVASVWPGWMSSWLCCAPGCTRLPHWSTCRDGWRPLRICAMPALDEPPAAPPHA
jgi:hypothetical protein